MKEIPKKIDQLYMTHYTYEDGTYRWWVTWDDERDRLTGKTVLQNDVLLIEVEHSQKVSKGIFRRRTEIEKRRAYYSADEIRYIA
jgi:hypothetical protein